MWNEFKEFAMKGSAIDLAVGVIIGGAFGRVVTSLVDYVLMPPLGLLIGGVDFSQLKVVLRSGTDKGDVAISYGLFLQTVVQFLIVAWALFLLIRAINHLRKKPEVTAPAAPPEDILLLREIRDLLVDTRQ
ncbi:MAG: large-conductance mechanosensitive channel protein MscL [Bdellovibrionales bacterium]